jgi:hypothetical protein
MNGINLILLLIAQTVLLGCGQTKSIEQSNSENIKLIEQVTPKPAENDKFSLRKYSFELINENGNCILSYKKETIERKLKLSIKAPCKVARWSGIEKQLINGKVSDVKKGEVAYLMADKYVHIKAYALMIAEIPSKTNLCRTETTTSYQVVLVRSNQIKLAGKRVGNICIPDEINEPNFQFAAEEKIP